MRIERLIGLLVLIGSVSLAMYFFYPEKNKNLELQNNSKIIESNVKQDTLEANDFEKFTESDFDFFVYRAHVLSSKENANKLKIKINNGGLPAFVEVFGDKEELFAVYVGPFLSEDDIVSNMNLVQKLSESKNGEISRWKL